MESVSKYKMSMLYINSVCLLIMSFEDFSDFRYALILPFFALYSIHVVSNKQSKGFLLLVLSLFFFVTLYSILGFLSIGTFHDNMGSYDSWEFFISFSPKILLCSIFLLAINLDFNKLYKIIGLVLKFHVALFFLQFVLVYISGYYLDVLSWFSDETSRYTWGVSIPLIGQTYRPTGAYVEPSTYFAMLMPFLILRYLISSRIEIIDKLAIVTFILTLSFASIAITIIFLILVYTKKSTLTKYAPIIIISLIIIIPSAFYLYLLRTSGDYNALGLRMNLIDIVFNQNYLSLIFGNGPAGLPKFLSYLYNEGTSWVQEGIAPINDSGLIFYFIVKFGFVGVLLCIFRIFKQSYSKRYFFCSILIFFMKIKLTSLVCVLYFILILFGFKKNKLIHN